MLFIPLLTLLRNDEKIILKLLKIYYFQQARDFELRRVSLHMETEQVKFLFFLLFFIILLINCRIILNK